MGKPGAGLQGRRRFAGVSFSVISLRRAKNRREHAQTLTISHGSLYDTVYLKVIQPYVPNMLQWSGPATVKGGPTSAKS